MAPFNSDFIKYSQYVAWRGCLNTRQIVTFSLIKYYSPHLLFFATNRSTEQRVQGCAKRQSCAQDDIGDYRILAGKASG
jgi:hypothetical protein